MRVRDHLAVSTVGAALVVPWSAPTAVKLWAGSVLVDVDHYLWFWVRRRDWNPAAAVRFFNGALPPQHATTRVLHTPAAAIALLLLGVHRRWLLSVALGVALHIALDAQHDARMADARRAALARDDYTCQACGTRARVGTHLRRQPWLLPSYRPRHLISLCAQCHENAHARGA
jgi:hypothetical protein